MKTLIIILYLTSIHKYDITHHGKFAIACSMKLILMFNAISTLYLTAMPPVFAETTIFRSNSICESRDQGVGRRAWGGRGKGQGTRGSGGGVGEAGEGVPGPGGREEGSGRQGKGKGSWEQGAKGRGGAGRKPCVKLLKDDDNPCVRFTKDDDNPQVKLIKDDDNP